MRGKRGIDILSRARITTLGAIVMPFTIEHEFEGALYIVVGDASELRIKGPDRPGVIVHFVKIFHECSIAVTALHADRPEAGVLIVEFEFEVEELDDINLLMEELAKTP